MKIKIYVVKLLSEYSFVTPSEYLRNQKFVRAPQVERLCYKAFNKVFFFKFYKGDIH
jgi:hypothetical protein